MGCSCTAIVSSFNMATHAQLAVGIAVAIGVAASTAVWTATSTRNYRQNYTAEKRRESWEMRNYPKGEIEEMVELYRSRGLKRADAETVIETMAKYESFFVDVMMVEELGLLPPSETSVGSLTAVAFLSSLAGAIWPLIGFHATSQSQST